MATTPEGKVKAWVKSQIVKKYPKAWIHMPVSMGMGSKGVPDMLITANGKFIAIETKADKSGRVTELQKRQIGLINASGAYAVVMYGKDEAVLNDVFAYLDFI